jgi:hypothetical protein
LVKIGKFFDKPNDFKSVGKYSVPIPGFTQLVSGVYSASNRNEYQKISGGKVQPVSEANNLTAINGPIV